MNIEGGRRWLIILAFIGFIFISIQAIKVKKTREFRITCQDKKNIVNNFCSQLKKSIFKKKVGNRCEKDFISIINDKEICFTSKGETKNMMVKINNINYIIFAYII